MRRLLLLAATVAVLVLAAIGALATGRAFLEAGESLDELAQASAWVPVESRPIKLVTGFLGVGQASPAPLLHSPVSGVVTEVASNDSFAVGNGDRIATVSGVPIVLVDQALFVPFRDLQRGDRGADVGELQTFLTATGHFGGEVDAVFGQATQVAVESFYADHGVERQRVFTVATALSSTETPVHIDSVLVERGETVNTNTPLVSLQANEIYVVASLPAAEALAYSIGMAVELVSNEVEFLAGEIVELGPVQQLVGSSRTRDVFVRSSGSIVHGARYRVERVLEATDGAVMAVPVLAVQSDPVGQTYVRVRTNSGTSRTVDVQIGLSDGDVVEVNGDLSLSDVVKIPLP